MKYRIQEDSSAPAYLQLYYQLRQDIVHEIYKKGAKLPSKRLLAEEAGCSVITVEHAYSILCDEGYAESRERSGYFVVYQSGDFLSTQDSPLCNERSASYPHTTAHSNFPFSVLSKTMRRVLVKYGDRILVKSPNNGCPELRKTIADYLARSNGMTVSIDQIIIGSGAEYLYSMIAQLLGNDRIFALESPSYDKIKKVYESNGVTCELLEMDSDGIKTSELKRTNASVLHVTPFHSFPSGVTADVSKRNEYLEWAIQRNGVLIEDNFDSELTVSRKNEDTVFSMGKQASVIYLNTFSKTIAPSVRIGYMVLPEHLLREFEEKLGFYSCTVPVFEQYVLAELIASGDFERHINRMRRARRNSLSRS